MGKQTRFSVVHEQNFIRATRSTGYRSTASAVAELVDNAIQAKANKIQIAIFEDQDEDDKGVAVAVLDNGCGMDRHTLRTALRFGGSSRFDDRAGPGRFGMGLPNASVSQARRVEVYTWSNSGKPIFSYIDVDEIAAGHMVDIPVVRRARLPDLAIKPSKKSGTLILWRKCDHLDNKRISTLVRKLEEPLGRQFRYFLWAGTTILVNGEQIKPVDPLYLNETDGEARATLFGQPLEYELRIPREPTRTSTIRVRFTELPIPAWHSLSPEEKRRRGISKGAGISIVRAKREVDAGWYFFGDKRKENYDDWWRCELTYDPELDEYFGITHSKQAVNPTDELREILSPDLEAAAHALNSRARNAYALVKATTHEPSEATKVASANDKYLLPMPERESESPPAVKPTSGHGPGTGEPRRAPSKYVLSCEPLDVPDFFVFGCDDKGRIVITINKSHAFYDRVYGRLRKNGRAEDLYGLECLLLAVARAELGVANPRTKRAFAEFRTAWSNALETFLDH